MALRLARFSGLMLVLLSTGAQALVIPYESRAAYDAANPGFVLETWDAFAVGTIFPDGSALNGITYNTSTTGAAQVIANTVFFGSTDPNNLGDSAAGGFFNAVDTITFTFASAINSFGIDINTFSESDGDYSATTNIGDVVGSVFDPFPTRTTGQFIGFNSTEFFSSVTISTDSGVSYNLDTLRAGIGVVPVPAAFWYLASAIVGLGLSGKKKH